MLRAVGRPVALLGRDAELRAALELLEESTTGGRVLVVEGEAGIGKTRFVDEVVHHANRRDIAVLRAAATSLESQLPFAPLLDALGVSDAKGEASLASRLSDAIDERSATAPLVLAVEDLHWADRPTLAVLARTIRHLAHLRLLLVLSARPYPRAPDLDALVDLAVAGGGRAIVLGPLASDDVVALAQQTLGASPGGGLLRKVASGGGNPLFVTELLSALQLEGAISVADGTADVLDAGLPPSLRLTILRRLSVLPALTIETLRVAAVLGTRIDVGALAACTRTPAMSVVRALEPARQAALLGEVDGVLGFRHDLVAPHLAIAALTADERTIEQLRACARAVRRSAPAMAVELLERAVEIADPAHPGLEELRLSLAVALGRVGRRVEAVAAADAVLAGSSGELHRRALLVRVQLAVFTDDLAEMLRRVESSAEEADDHQRAQLLAAASQLAYGIGDVDAAVRMGSLAVELAECLDDDIVAGHALRLLATALQGTDPARAEVHARRAVEIGRRAGRTFHAQVRPPELSLALVIGDQPSRQGEAIELARAALLRCEALELPALDAQVVLGIALYRAGRWEEAAVELEAAVERSVELDADTPGVLNSMCRLGRLALHRDDLPLARAWLDRADLIAHTDRSSERVHLVLARAWLRDAEGATRDAFELLLAAHDSEPTPTRPWIDTVIEVKLVQLAVALGETTDPRVAAVLDGDDNDRHRWLRAVLADDLDALLDSVSIARRRGTALREEHPMRLEDVAGALLRRDRRTEALPLLEEAQAVWAEMGATREVARVDARLRAAGVRRGSTASRGRPTTGWAALTATEERVVALVAEGLTYREVGERLFISRRTVETHVAHIFTKVGVANRGELEAAYATR
jgi:DNA-binding CsgD family transcriptional regulator/tetratricopeptide (TPR) repeat protein